MVRIAELIPVLMLSMGYQSVLANAWANDTKRTRKIIRRSLFVTKNMSTYSQQEVSCWEITGENSGWKLYLGAAVLAFSPIGLFLSLYESFINPLRHSYGPGRSLLMKKGRLWLAPLKTTKLS